MPTEALDPSYESFSREPAYIEVNRALIRGLPIATGDVLADLACGTGALTALVVEEAAASAPRARVIGVDLSAEALGLARRHLRHGAPGGKEVALVRASCDRLPLADATVDVALMGNAIQLFGDKDRLLHEVGRVLRVGGTFAFNTSFYAGAYLPGTEGFYLTWVQEALRYLSEKDRELRRHGGQGIRRRKGRGQRAFSNPWLSPAQFEELLRRHGFEVASAAVRVVTLTRRSLEAIGGYAGLATVLLGGYPPALACEALQRAARPALKAARLEAVPRGWWECIAAKVDAAPAAPRTATRRRPLHGQVGIVTGGSGGIGRATCLALADKGASVVVVGRSPDRVRQTVAQVERLDGVGGAVGLTLDVRREPDMQALAEEVLRRFGRIDILVASAGRLRGASGRPRRLVELSTREWDEIVDTNLKGVFLSNRAVLPAMIRQRSGTIVNLSSTSGLKGLAFDSAYCASKFGVIGLSEAVAAEVGRFGIVVHALLPGPVATPMWRQNGPIPQFGALIGPQRIADAVCQVALLAGDARLSPTIITPRVLRSGTGPPPWDVPRLSGGGSQR